MSLQCPSLLLVLTTRLLLPKNVKNILSSHRTGLFCSFFSFWPFSPEQSPGIISATSLFVLMGWLLCSVEPKLQFRCSAALATGRSGGTACGTAALALPCRCGNAAEREPVRRALGQRRQRQAGRSWFQTGNS